MAGSAEPRMMMDDSIDMEEGEASCYYKENRSFLDPDITLSYIDEKIERFLGHFRKDFEGGVSAEKLGSKFGGYGSFLPMYERPPLLPQQKNQQRECNVAPSPDKVPLNGSSQNPKAPQPERPEAIVSKTISSHNTRETSGSISGKVDSCFPSTKETSSCPSKVEASIRLGCLMNKRSLKFRIKLGSDSTGLKNAAIYSGLGLEDSPFSSSENSSDISEGMLPIPQCPPDESPTKIIEAMTSFPVPHGALISPLHDSLLGLSRKEKPPQETKPVLSPKDKKDGLAKRTNETTLKQNDSTLVKKKKEEVGHRERQVNHKNEVCASLGKEKTTLVNGNSENEAFGSKNLLPNELQCKPVSEGMVSNVYPDPQKKKLSRKATLHETGTEKGSIKKEKPEIVGKKKLEVPQTAGGKITGSFEKSFEFRSEASKGRKDTDSDTPESENRRPKLKLHCNQKVGASNRDSFNTSGLDENRKSKDVIERASGDLRKIKSLDDSGVKTSKSSMVVEPTVVAPVDEWVCCDSCQKWRLLPFGAKPQLPEKWLCSMLTWLPGMNRCDISEEETTAKLYALYQLPLPGSADVLQNHANGLTSGDTSNQGKKKGTLKEIQNPVSRDDQTHGKSSLKNQQPESRKNRSLNGLSNPPNQLRNSMDQLKEKFTDRGGEGTLKHGDIDLKKHNKLNTENKMQISLKKRAETAEISANPVSDKSACTKKRKLKDRQDDQNSHNSALREPVLPKKESCEKSKKKKKSDVSNDFAGGMEEISRDKEPKMQNKKIVHKQTSVGKELLKRNLGTRQVSTAANSSSSNVSQSHLTKAKFEVKVSPAESVSSSPMRTSILDHSRLCNNHIDDCTKPSQKKRKKVFPDKELSGAVRLQKRSRDFEAENKGGLRSVGRGECKEEPSHFGGDSLQVSSRVANSHQLIANAPKSDDAVDSKTLKDLGNVGNASNLDRTKSSNQTACNTLKEAKKLRDNADNLKSAGFIFESNELYFQSALQYLHGAFLLETLDNASGKHGDMTHMQFYGITAELCESCALEYERRGEAAAAALAFKCIEVAYLRIVYHKHSSVNADRLEMQSLFCTIMQGESPSSSASDVDNLSNQGAMDKATSDKVGGSYSWNSGNCTRFARVLDFARDMNKAMEASRKSRNAFVAASSCGSEGKHVDYVASVKKVIDFSFQDVGELVQLVRVATQTITHSSFGSVRD